MLLFDAHLDLSLNALDWNRDLRLSAEDLRNAESGMDDMPGRGAGTVTLPEMRRGEVGICVATLLAPTSRPENPVPAWNSPPQSWAHMQGQIAWYRAMCAAGEMRLISDCVSMEKHLGQWKDGPVGYVLSLEGADPIIELSLLEELYNDGLRALGPAHYGPGRWANGTDSTGGLSPKGRDLISEMDRLGIILDVSHLCDDTFWEALGIFEGAVWASHTNSRVLVPHNRQNSDEQYKALIERGAVIGVVADAWMLAPGWMRHESTPAEMGVTIETMIDHIDHICQLASNADHVGIGSDLDGGFGREQSPADLDTIADLQRLEGLLAGRGYAAADIEKIFHGNFLRVLRHAWTG